MKYSVLVLMLTLGLIAMAPPMKMKVIFFGDSITQAGVKPGGYIHRIQEHLNSSKGGENYELIGAGIGGNKVYDLYLRLQEDVLDKQPNIVFIYVGVNDVWHKATSGTGTDRDKFLRFYSAMIEKMKAQNIKVILVTPAVIGEKLNYTNQQDGDLNAYSQFVKGLAEKHDCKLVDLRKAFTDYISIHNPENKESGILTTDRVHLNDTGNQLVADEMMKVLGVK